MYDYEGLDSGFVYLTVSAYRYLNRCICIYILCVSPEKGFYDYLLVHAVIDCERSLIFFEPIAWWIYLSVTIVCAYDISLEMFSVSMIICWCVRSSIVNVVLHALSREFDEFTCSLPFYVRMKFPLRCSFFPGPSIVSHRVSFMFIFLSSHFDSRILCAQLCPRAYLRPRASLICHGSAQFRPRAK